MIRAALLTIVVETGFFALWGHREKMFLLYCALVNLFTNLTLNLLLSFVYIRWGPAQAHWLVLPLEGCVVAAEYAFFRQALPPGPRLFLLTLCANLITYTLAQ